MYIYICIQDWASVFCPDKQIASWHAVPCNRMSHLSSPKPGHPTGVTSIRPETPHDISNMLRVTYFRI